MLSILDRTKTALRITCDAFDPEIEMLIAGARSDLLRCGIRKEHTASDADPLIVNAIITYCRASFGLDNADAEKLQASYEQQRCNLMIDPFYNGGDLA